MRRFRELLRQQLGFLETSCIAYDRGQLAEGVRIATTLRTLFKTRGKTKSLLSHLGNPRISMASATTRRCEKVVAASDLCVVVGHANRMEDSWIEPNLEIELMLPFDQWWAQQPVLVVSKELVDGAKLPPVITVPLPVEGQPDPAEKYMGRAYSRQELAETICDKDGGAHVDADLPPDYPRTAKIGLEQMMPALSGFRLKRSLTGLHFCTMRAIANEVLSSPDLLSLSGPN